MRDRVVQQDGEHPLDPACRRKRACGSDRNLRAELQPSHFGEWTKAIGDVYDDVSNVGRYPLGGARPLETR